MAIPKEWLTFLREQYPDGSQVKIREMDGPYSTLFKGTGGKLEHIDEDGRFHTRLDNGQTVALTIGKGRFSIEQPEPTTLKLFMPLTASVFSFDEYGDMENESSTLYGRDLLDYEDEILAALVKYRMPEETERGIMHWYSADDTVNAKVKSVVFTAEEKNGQLWGVAECRIVGTLQPTELETLKDYLTGQASDGWGEGFEQQEIDTDGGEIYVHLWSFDNDWSIQTEQERFAPKIAEGLPEMCFSVLGTTGELICLKRGVTGYFPSEYSVSDKEKNIEFADRYNEKLGVTMWQRQAMEVGSLCGWDVPGADPAKYQEPLSPQMGGMTFG